MLEKNNGVWYCMDEGGYVYWYVLDAFEFVRDLGKSIKAIIDAIVLITKGRVALFVLLHMYVYLFARLIYPVLSLFQLPVTHLLGFLMLYARPIRFQSGEARVGPVLQI
ncbi:MAG: hypothetical protein WAM14_16910 [Candidatus Nitrosopolaris sp.]